VNSCSSQANLARLLVVNCQLLVVMVPDHLKPDRSAAALRLDEAVPWYLEAGPLSTLPWLIRLRWTTAAIEALVVAVALLGPAFDVPMRRVAWLIAISAVANVWSAVWLARSRALPAAAESVRLALTILLLTGLLELTGGPFNPFCVIYLAIVALAALTLGRVQAAGLAACAAVGYSVLVYWHTMEVDAGHHRLNDFPTHLFTMWIAIAATGELAAYFVAQASHALARREQELEAMRDRAAKSERLVSLTTLAAGAAHELSTPLATIALASRELERALQATAMRPDLTGDARLIRAEVDRCRTILDQMSGRAGGAATDRPQSVDLSSIIEDVRSKLSAAQASRFEVRLPDLSSPVVLPRTGFGQALLSLVKNAFDATDGSVESVVVDVTRNGDRLRVTVRDRGRGMSPDILQRAGEPFFTTKEAGRGLGLGLFLARVFAERCGGALTIHSQDGTAACLELPVAAVQGHPHDHEHRPA
jgi:two-component system sensor histidine kinase RegB